MEVQLVSVRGGGTLFSNWVLDIRYSLRRLRQSPLFTITAALSLAIGIGANTAIFSLGSALLLRPVTDVHEPGRVVDIGRTQRGKGFDTASYLNYLDLRAHARTLDGIYAYDVESAPMNLGMAGDAERVYGNVVSGNYFDVLQVRPRLGRMLQDADDHAGNSPVAVLSENLWLKRFGGDPGVVGRNLVLNGQTVTVVGIAPSGFTGTTFMRSDVWLPITAVATAMPRMNADVIHQRSGAWLMMGGRLKPGVSAVQSDSELGTLGAELEREYPKENKGRNYRTASLSQFPGLAGTVAQFIAMLMALVSLILFIACVNLVGMLLARAAQQEREVAVRLAIGASRARLIRQMLTEIATLFLLGGALGLLLSYWLLKALLSFLPQLPIPIALAPSTDWRVMAFAAVVTLLATLASGLAPALQTSSTGLMYALKSSGADAGAKRMRLRDAFLVTQIMMSLLLVIAGGLFVRALGHAAQVDPGFDQNHVEVVSLDLSLGGYKEQTGASYLREVLQRVRTLPNVHSASATADLPLDGGRMGLGDVKVPGVPAPRGAEGWSADANVIEPGMLQTLKLPLLRGREFTEQDSARSEAVVIVNAAMAKAIWPGQDALGKQIEMEAGQGKGLRRMTVVGVAADARLMSLNDPAEPYFYVPFSQYYMPRMSLLVRTKDGSSVVPQLRKIMHSLNPNLPFAEALPLSSVTALELIPQKIAAMVASSLGLIGMLLAGMGIYGVTAYAVSRRKREIAIRMALGADHGQVIRHMLRHTVALAAIGLALGAAIAAGVARLLESFLFGMKGVDVLTFSSALVLFAAVTMIAGYVPARRASSVDPAEALKSE